MALRAAAKTIRKTCPGYWPLQLPLILRTELTRSACWPDMDASALIEPDPEVPEDPIVELPLLEPDDPVPVLPVPLPVLLPVPVDPVPDVLEPPLVLLPDAELPLPVLEPLPMLELPDSIVPRTSTREFRFLRRSFSLPSRTNELPAPVDDCADWLD